MRSAIEVGTITRFEAWGTISRQATVCEPIQATASDSQILHRPWASNAICSEQLTHHHCFFIGSPELLPLSTVRDEKPKEAMVVPGVRERNHLLVVCVLLVMGDSGENARLNFGLGFGV